eukprot:CAMPEP_0172309118 /NCGR_PEP_ID=MMETSP1058-20130122/9497_1 /TAXON_ID=83371 /ORGANISM="Detonula confervacea, Strain CCMP 353" /LENGTH=458 /DNA_ID=CAMNT_0013021679 /DNA_START=65 /DNA_END=1441 /DNA_ORIENTATION=+
MSFATMTSNTDSATAATQKGLRKSASLPPETVEYLKAWMMSPEHVAHPYPTEQEKAQIMAETGIELKQLTNWFVNNRKRFWKPRVEAKLQKYNAPPGAIPPAQQQGTGTGGLSISIHQMNPKPQHASTAFPILSNDESAAPLYSQGSGGLASLHDHANFPTAGVVNAVAASHEYDPHTISEGSASSACNSDDDSLDAAGSCNNRSSFGAVATQYLDSRLASGDSSSSTTGSISSVSGGYRRHEEVDVHVLRPDGSTDVKPDQSEEPLPTLRDLTIKTSIPKERILATFKCPISYTIPYEIEHDRKKVQSRRDGEVLRVKKHYLKLYLATRGIHSASSPVGNDSLVPIMTPPLNDSSILSTIEASAVAALTVHDVSPLKPTSAPVQTSSSSRSRAISCIDLAQDDSNSNPAPRKRARTASGSFLKGEDEWRQLCQHAKSLYCETLPGVEEAARMFGYAS